MLKTKEQRAAEKALMDKSPLATLTLEDFLESERHKLSGTLTPVTPETFAKWKKERLGKAVKTVYGLIPLKLALDWPVSASYDELAACATWMGGRILTLEEARSVYIYSEEIAKLQAENAQGRKIPAVNG